MPLASGLPSLEEIFDQRRERRCRVCGCTDNNACLHPEHGPCWWVEDDLCSHCGEPSIVMGDYDALLLMVNASRDRALDGPEAHIVELETWARRAAAFEAWARRARAALQHVSQAKADLFEL